MIDELLSQFLIEGPEQVQQASDALLALEQSPADQEAIDQAFRAIHTLKGSVGLFDLPAMASVLHRAEDVLGAIRSGERGVDASAVGGLLAVLGQIERWLAGLAKDGRLPAEAEAMAEALIGRLSQSSPEIGSLSTTLAETPDWLGELLADLPSPPPDARLHAIQYLPNAGAYFAGDDPIAIMAAAPGLIHLQLGLTGDGDPAETYDPFTCRLKIEAISTATEGELRSAFRLVSDQVSIVSVDHRPRLGSAVSGQTSGSDPASRTLRIDVRRIDALATLSTELIAAKTALSSAVSVAGQTTDTRSFAEVMAAHAAQLDRLTNRLHEATMALRLAPIGPVLRRFPRLIREIADGLGKEIDLEIDDAGVEADKSVVEGLVDPLTHLLRNAIDHGIETRAVRLKGGKPSKGRITVAAYASAGRLIVQLKDDGAGVDPEAIRRRVRERAMMDDSQLEVLTDAEAINLVFMPGFSTAERVTDLSGRGVGMDAVRTAIEALGGRVSLASAPGQGTRVELSLPLTVSLTKVIVVRDKTDRYGIPLDQVLETLRVAEDRIVPIRSGRALNWRDKVVPLAPLSALTHGDSDFRPGDHRVVVVRTGAGLLGIAVDAIEDRLDVSMRPLDGVLAGMPGISGAAILGNGEVLMILDPSQASQ